MSDAAVEVSADGPSEVDDVARRLVEAAISLLARGGPSAIKARAVAAEAGMSTMVVYSRFGGVPELVAAVVDQGYAQIEQRFVSLTSTDDPVHDLFSMALVTLDLARASPHLYDAMFGLSTRATYRPTAEDKQQRKPGRSEAFRSAYAHVVEACERLSTAGRVAVLDPEAVAGALWSFVHGYIALELADQFADFEDPVVQVLAPMATTFAIGMGDDPARARASHASALAARQAGTTSPTPTRATSSSHAT